MGRPFHLFSLLGIPVFADAGFLVLLALSTFGAGDVKVGIVWAFCITLSLLVHELGHAVVSTRFGLQPAVVLHMWGGLTYHQPARRDRDDALVIAAGPGSGILFGLTMLGVSLAVITVKGEAVLNDTNLGTLLNGLVFLNLFWSAVNLIPLWPLDGGQLFRLAMIRVVPERHLDRVVHGVAVVLALGVVAVAVALKQPFLALLTGLLAWENAEILLGRKASPSVRRRNGHADELLAQARRAYAKGEHREALRLAHHLRAERNLPEDLVGAAWEVLVLASAATEAWDEVIRYARYAPDNPSVRAAVAKAEAARGGVGSG